MRGNLALLPLACVGVLLSACGDSGTSTTTATGHGIEITGTSAADRKMAADLRNYIGGGCRGTESPSALARALDAHPADKRQVLKRYGSIERLFQSARFQQIHRVCASYQQLDVDGGVITVTTSLSTDDQGRSDAQIVCDTVRASDVADRTTHTILGDGSNQLATCPPS
jgi:hypothetical protein